jgi:hypothetical protein
MPHDDPERTTPIGLVRYSSEFYAAAVAADASFGRKPGYEVIAPIPVIPVNYLLRMYLAIHDAHSPRSLAILSTTVVL